MLLVAHRMPATAAGCTEFTAAGADLFECDVQLRGPAGAETVVVSHFLPLLRVRGWVEHDNARFRWRAGRRPDPTLAEALALAPPETGILLDPKETDPRRRARLVDALAEQAVPHGRFRVSTEHDADLARYRAAGLTAWRTIKTRARLQAVLRDGLAEPDVVSIRHTLLDRHTVDALHATVGSIVAWTVDDPARATGLRALGVEGITTDRQEVMRAVTSAGTGG